MPRKIDINFDPDEKLWRQVSREQLDPSGLHVKPNALRVQISVSRQRYGKPTPGPSPFNGVAEILVRDASGVAAKAAYSVCVDFPTHTNDGHATIAIVAPPGTPTDWADLLAVRAELAARMQVIVEPK